MKPRQLPWKWLLLGLVVVLLAGLALVPRHIGTSAELRDRLARVLSDWTGGTITLTEPLHVGYFPPVSLRGGFVLTNATKLPSVSAITAPDVKISLDFLELLMGRIKIDGLRIGKPTITLKETDAAAPPDQTLEALITGALTDPPVGAVRIRQGRIKTASGARLISNLDARLDARGRSGALGVLGSFKYHGETVAFAIDSGKIADMEGGKGAPLTLKVTSDPVTASFSGTAHFADGLEAEGDMQAKIGNARRFLTWVGIALPQGESLQNLTAAGTVHWSGATLTFDDGTFSLDGNEAVGLLALTAGERPRVEGTLDFERLVLDPYLGHGDNPAPGAPFDWALLKYIDADLRISAADIAASTMELGRGGFTITAKQGAISSEVGELDLCGGQMAGRLGLDLSGARTKASFTGNLSEVVIETCLQPFDLGVPVKGGGSLKIDVSTGGTTSEELIRGLVGVFKVTAQKGAVPIDFPELSSGADAKDEGWSREAATRFDSLEADCRLSAGHIWCQSFSMQTPRGVVSGSGGVDVGKQTLDWDFLIANPAAPLNASQLVMESPPRVTVQGSLTQPLIQRTNRTTLGDGSPQTNPENSSASPH